MAPRRRGAAPPRRVGRRVRRDPDPAGAGASAAGLGSTGSAVFNALWTLLYMPCLTLPAGEGPDGLPVGIQLVGRRHDDARLLDVALWVERTLGARQ